MTARFESEDVVANKTPEAVPVGGQAPQNGAADLERSTLSGKSMEGAHTKTLEISGIDPLYFKKVAIYNEALSEIGFGRYNIELFFLCGFGWLADNMWLQAIAVILPEIGKEFDVEDRTPFVTLSLYVGLILGATFWGFGCDIVGRRLAFNVTLAISGIFGIAAGAAPNFVGLGGLVACIGIGLGGNLPVDSALFIEFIPARNQNLLTLLSIFWSIGQLIASLVGWALIANYSCASDIDAADCRSSDNRGWRYTFYTLGAFTFAGFIARYFIFSIYESPKYLLSKGEDEKAYEVIEGIAKRNGKDISSHMERLKALREINNSDDADSVVHYMSMAQRLRLSMSKFDLDHFRGLFCSKKLAFSTTLIIFLWGMIGLAYPLYNGFLPTYLSERSTSSSSGVNETYRNYAIISAASIPGSFLAALIIELKIGRKGGMSLGTLLVGVFLFLFTTARSSSAVLGFNCAAGVCQQIMYGVLYSYTPEVFPGPHRGTGNGLAGSFNRICGMMAPIIKVYAGNSSPDAPIYVSAALFLVAGLLMILLPYESRGKAAL